MQLVTQMPLDHLWDENGDVAVRRERLLTKQSLREMLHRYPVEFFVADIGRPLFRVDVTKCYDFWKQEVAAHLVDDPEGAIRLAEFSGEYAYIASEWMGEIQTPIVLLEKYH